MSLPFFHKCTASVSCNLNKVRSNQPHQTAHSSFFVWLSSVPGSLPNCAEFKMQSAALPQCSPWYSNREPLEPIVKGQQEYTETEYDGGVCQG